MEEKSIWDEYGKCRLCGYSVTLLDIKVKLKGTTLQKDFYRRRTFGAMKWRHEQKHEKESKKSKL